MKKKSDTILYQLIYSFLLICILLPITACKKENQISKPSPFLERKEMKALLKEFIIIDAANQSATTLHANEKFPKDAFYRNELIKRKLSQQQFMAIWNYYCLDMKELKKIYQEIEKEI